MDLFQEKNIKPMLIGATSEPFNNPNYIYELKLDGERCIAYLGQNETDLRNKRNMKMLPKVPELSRIHKQIKNRCILDGELIIIKDGVPNFDEIKRRSLLSNPFKIELLSKKHAATFTAFDILYYDNGPVTHLPLMERKTLLAQAFTENERLALSRYIEKEGAAFYHLAKERDLEGVVAKRMNSVYKLDSRTKDWVKIKYLKDEDFVVCGYINKDGDGHPITSIILGLYENGSLIYQGHVTLGLSRKEFETILSQPKLSASPFSKQDENAVYIHPNLVCTVKYMERMKNGGLRQPVFKGLRMDKRAKECVVNQLGFPQSL